LEAKVAKKTQGVADDSVLGVGLTPFEGRLTNLLALFLVKGMKQADQIDTLSRVGFKPAEVAALLGTTGNTVSVTLYQQKRARTK